MDPKAAEAALQLTLAVIGKQEFPEIKRALASPEETAKAVAAIYATIFQVVSEAHSGRT